MNRVIKTIENIMDFIARNILLAVFSVIFVVGLVVKAMYCFDDSPYFTLVKWYDILIGIIIVLFYALVFYKRDWIQSRLKCWVCFVVFMAAAVLYILLVPTIPFSDMAAVYTGAIEFSKFNWAEMLNNSYWNMFPGNILLSVFWGILIIPFPKTLITFKILNALMLYGVAWLTGEAAKLYGVKHYKLVYVCVLTFSPAFIYINHVYFDLPLVFLCVLALYVYKRHNNLILALGILGIARYLRKSASIFMLALLIVHIFKIFKTRDKADKKTAIKTVIKKLVVVVAGVVVFSAVYKIPTRLVWNKFVNGNFTGNSSWNMYYIGINEAEFGFMDNDFAKDRSKQDVIDRVKEYGPWRMTKIFVKKTFWLWSQGTYQAQRYGFGSDVQDEDMLTKFEYQTILTNHLLRDDQPLRKILNSVMRDQYYVMFGLMILTMMDRRKTERYRGFYYAFIATFLIMLVYELKSRYVFHLFPLMIVMAVDGTELLEKRLEAFKTNKIKMKQIRNI